MKWIVMFAALAGFGLGSAQNRTAAPDKLEARNLVLVDEKGRKRGEMSMDPDGHPFVRLYDPEGKVIWDTDPRLYLLSK